MSVSVKKAILLRIYIAFIAVCLFGIAIVMQAFRVQTIEGHDLIARADSLTTDYIPIDAERGNIMAEDGRVLASSLPYYEIRADLNAEALTKTIFDDGVHGLAVELSKFKKDRSATEYERILRNARASGNRYFLIAKNVTYPELRQIRKWPLFEKGRNKGGLIAIQTNKRSMPYQILAHRTIGYAREGIKPVGLEGRFDAHLAGVRGKRLMQRISGGTWIPVNDDNEIMPVHGKDIITTLDINLQDVAENALMKAMHKHSADHGSVIVMEVKTGKIRAIANLGLTSDGEYWETMNYAVGEASEPGSTMKLATYLALLEDGYIDIDDSVDLELGTTQFYNRTMKDSEKHNLRNVTVQHAFEISSNVAAAKLANKYYAADPRRYVEHLRELMLDKLIGIEIDGEAESLIRNPGDRGWSGVSLPWMSVGYETKLTPLHMITLYNAVANNGKMMKPYLVSAIQERGKTVEEFQPVVMKDAICSEKTLSKLRIMLEGVVERGTADHLKTKNYTFAGKTGTALMAAGAAGYNQKIVYQASFAGYFPADEPMYSCVVVIKAPKNGMYYGGWVAAPVFREIADKVVSNCIEMHDPVNTREKFYADVVPNAKGGYRPDVSTIYETIGVSCNYNQDDNWIYPEQHDNSVELKARKVKDGIVPDVRGMGLRDALYLLENEGLHVRFVGKGKVRSQSIRFGTPSLKGSTIVLELG